VLEGAAGEEYRQLMKRTIFDPAGMGSTVEDDPRAILPDRAAGYVLEDSVLKVSRWADMSAKLPAGGWVTTASDLVRFMQAWMDGKFVSDSTRAVMLTPYVLPGNGGTVDGYGMGWFLDLYHGMGAALPRSRGSSSSFPGSAWRSPGCSISRTSGGRTGSGWPRPSLTSCSGNGRRT